MRLDLLRAGRARFHPRHAGCQLFRTGEYGAAAALAKQQNSAGLPLSFGSGGSGTTAHLGAEVLKQTAGINMVHVPYRGTSQAMTDVLTGRVDMMFAPIVVALLHIQSGAVRGLSITSPDRSPLLPEVPTVREAGLPEAETEVWIGLFAPARTPEAVIGTLYDGLVRALKMPACGSASRAVRPFQPSHHAEKSALRRLRSWHRLDFELQRQIDRPIIG
jgi:tripartite-type tricarboxylate transporter receptor subunit TctC